jgi:ATP-dependent RNA helicase RhlE
MNREETPPNHPDAFHRLGLSAKVLTAVRVLGFVNPTPIQEQAIPLILAGEDVIGRAQTGTGKTAAFGLPILSRLESHQPQPRVLILEPTRELAAQVLAAITSFSQYTDLRSAVFFGGVGYGKQREALAKGVDILVATPGRLLDHVSRGDCRLDRIEYLVLDEADRMLDMGFLPDVRKIIQRCPRSRHTYLFSATIPIEITSLAEWAMRQPKTIEIGVRQSPADTIKHVLYPVSDSQKMDLLLELLNRLHYESVIVFCRTKHGADRVAHSLKKQGHPVAVLHSNRTQREREQALEGFRSGRYELLVATDIAARGLDILDVTHVVNYDVPQHPEDYIHRIGRTGRMAAKGDALTLMVAEDGRHVEAIERFIGRKITREKLENFDYRYTALFEQEKGGRTAPAARVRGARIRGGYYFGLSRRRR